jgi:hypothetical protein
MQRQSHTDQLKERTARLNINHQQHHTQQALEKLSLLLNRLNQFFASYPLPTPDADIYASKEMSDQYTTAMIEFDTVVNNFINDFEKLLLGEKQDQAEQEKIGNLPESYIKQDRMMREIADLSRQIEMIATENSLLSLQSLKRNLQYIYLLLIDMPAEIQRVLDPTESRDKTKRAHNADVLKKIKRLKTRLDDILMQHTVEIDQSMSQASAESLKQVEQEEDLSEIETEAKNETAAQKIYRLVKERDTNALRDVGYRGTFEIMFKKNVPHSYTEYLDNVMVLLAKKGDTQSVEFLLKTSVLLEEDENEGSSIYRTGLTDYLNKLAIIGHFLGGHLSTEENIYLYGGKFERKPSNPIWQHAFVGNIEEINRILSQMKRCDLLRTPDKLSRKAIKALPIQSNAAYIRSGNKLFYRNTAKNLCQEISLDKGDRKGFDKTFNPTYEARTLSQSEQEKIETILGSSHKLSSDEQDEFDVYNLRNRVKRSKTEQNKFDQDKKDAIAGEKVIQKLREEAVSGYIASQRFLCWDNKRLFEQIVRLDDAKTREMIFDQLSGDDARHGKTKEYLRSVKALKKRVKDCYKFMEESGMSIDETLAFMQAFGQPMEIHTLFLQGTQLVKDGTFPLDVFLNIMSFCISKQDGETRSLFENYLNIVPKALYGTAVYNTSQCFFNKPFSGSSNRQSNKPRLTYEQYQEEMEQVQARFEARINF